MNLYRFQVTIEQKLILGHKVVDVIIVAEDDESAFRLAEIEVERHYLSLPLIKEMVLYERKKIGKKGGGYVIDETVD